MKNFSKYSLWGGWLLFALSSAVYLMTMEPTASLWDCGEFIATSYKLEVGHPPGTPFFFLINRLGAILVGSPELAAPAINALSALESGLTIAFLFWSIAHLGRRLYRKNENELSESQGWAVLGAATIGALAYTFSDTFWFSAVEAEVYALSSLFTAVVFWAILKWENVADQPGSNRWLVLIAYLMGLSIGAHILNLLAIPALVFIYYFKKYPGRKISRLWIPGVIAVILTGVFYLLTPTVVATGAAVDKLFVNGFGLPVNSGMATLIVLILLACGYGVYVTHKKGKAVLNTILLSVGLVVIGFSTYGIVLIRAGVGTPMNSNNPSDPYTLLSFLNREQYGESQPLLYGRTYASVPTDYQYSTAHFLNEAGKYQSYDKIAGLEYDSKTEMFFSRMHSRQENHIEEYKYWANIKGHRIRTTDGRAITAPTFGENLRFFFTYQLNNMYWRYFLWNFVGRQSDIQNSGLTDGNWISGINFLDELYLGPQKDLPTEMAENKGRNKYFFLPFILGLIGFFYQLRYDGKNFLVVFLLFFMTGIAIILYLNQTPLQPRERDYAYAGSFYAYAIWIGLGLLWLFEFLKRKVVKKNARMAAIASILICLPVPVLMAVQNWDDHDRSNRYVARDLGRNYLNACLPNAIIIDYGDNDTFPLWYCQEVEGVRTDVRVMNASYLPSDWYTDQMRVRMNESAPIPHSMPRSKYYGDAIAQFYVQDVPRPDGSVWTIQEAMEVFNSDDPRSKLSDGQGLQFDYIPATRIAVPVNKENVLKSGIVAPEEAHLIEDTIYLNLEMSTLNVGEMVFLDVLANFDWERPIHFTSAADMFKFGIVTYNENEQWSYLQQDGMTYRLVPIKTPIARSFGIGRIHTETLYDNLMNKFQYGNIKNPRVYVDSFVHNSFGSSQLRSSFARLAEALVAQGDNQRAIEVLDRCMEEMPLEQLRVDDMVPYIVEAYYKAGATEKGDQLALYVGGLLTEYIDYFNSFPDNKIDKVRDDAMIRLRSLYSLYSITMRYRPDIGALFEPYFAGL